MPIDAELGRVGKIGAELDEERPEVFIQTVEVVKVHVGAAVVDPGNGATIAKGLAHRSGHARLFLGYADKDDPGLILLFESAQASLHDIVLTLALFEADQIDFVIERKLHDRLHKRLGFLRDLLGRSEAMPLIAAHKAGDTRLSGQLRDISVQIDPVDRFHLHDNMFFLEMESIDRIYLNAYVPQLTTEAGV